MAKVPSVSKDEILLRVTTPIFVGSKIQGTGFFFRKQVTETTCSFFLISARHVFEDIIDDHFTIKFRTKTEVIDVNLLKVNVVAPMDKDLDLASVNVTQLIIDYPENDSFFLTEAEIRTDDFLCSEYGAVIPVMMYGYPTGLYDDVLNLPLVRTGFTATHPGLNYKGKSEGMLNIANYIVDSGAPILTMPQHLQYSKSSRNLSLGSEPVIVFLGVHHESPTTHTHLGLNSPKEEDGREEQMALAYYIKASNLLSMLEWVKLE